MSGFVALFQRNGLPVDRGLLAGFTSFLSFRGPDARESSVSGSAGLGHTLLRTTRAPAHERQPMSLNGQCWIVADARLDRRTELRDRLISAGHDVAQTASDAELILHAYMGWKDDCVAHLRGDFAFAIWDSRERRFFCARDHFGIKPFYYAVTRDFFLCSNTLDCVRLHPAVSDELNDDAIADFLLFGLNCNQATTMFKDVQRLAPAHSLAVSETDSHSRKYWSPPVDGRIRYRRNQEYVEHFLENLRLAVADRLDVDRAGIFLSGGMDSGSVAAIAKEVAPATNLHAFTVTYEHLIGDREGYFAKETAGFLGIPIQLLPMDHIRPFEYAENDDVPSPEPADDPLIAGLREQFGAVAKHSRVVLDGEGIDNLMHFQLGPYTRYLSARGEWLTFARSVAGYLWKKRSRWHRIGSRVRTSINGGKEERVPAWIAPDFARRTNIEQRLRRYDCLSSSPAHPALPVGHASLELPQWTRMFEGSDPGFTKSPVEVRYPFLDLRIVEYMLALPPYPFFLDKTLERDAMKGKLPRSILARPKTPLVGDPAAVATAERLEFERWDWRGEIAKYVNGEALPAWNRPYSSLGTSCMRAVCLNFWLQSSRGVRYNLMAEVRNG